MKRYLLALLALACLLSSLGCQRTATFEGGTKQFCGYVPTVVLQGSWKQMGRQYGHLLSKNIRAVYDLVAPYKDKYNVVCDKNNAEIIEDFYRSYPQQHQDFFQGMAETSGLTLDELKAANALEIVLMAGSKFYQGRCSGLGVWGAYSKDGKVIFGRNYDYNPEFLPLNDSIVVAVFKPDDGSVPFAACTWAGCIYGSTGINRAGLFVEENDCSGHDKVAAGFVLTGKHYNVKNWVRDDALLLRLLNGARTMGQADVWMKKNLPDYPHNIAIADRKEARCYQWNIPSRVPHAPWVRQANGLLAQTNHYFIIPKGWKLATYQEIAVPGSTVPGNSIARLDNLLRLAKENKGKIDVKKMCEIMDIPLESGGATADSSLYQIVCEPETFTFRLKTRARRDRWVDIPVAELLK